MNWGATMGVFVLGDRKVEFRGSEWFIAESASIVGSVVIENQASIWFNVVVRGDRETITIGERCNVQDGSVLHADPGAPLRLGRNVSVGHCAMLHGCTIGDGSLVGINSVVLNHASIGRKSIVGANSLIPEGKSFPDGVLILGSPGRIVRELTRSERDDLLAIADGYVERAQTFRAQLKPQTI